METKVVKEALPLFLKGESDKAILIVHGFRGYAGEFYDLAHKLNEQGFNVSLPRLPGHGTDKKDFNSTGWKEWLNHIENAYYDLDAQFDSVELIGLSMGGVISLILASRLNPKRITLLAPAMAINSHIFKFTPILRYFLKEVANDWTAKEGDSDGIKKLGKEYWSHNSAKQHAQLHKLIQIAKKGLIKVTCPTLLILSKGDDSVPIDEASKIINTGLINSDVTEVTLEKSEHVLVVGCEKELVFKHIFDWVKK